MHSGVVGLADLCRLQVEPGNEPVEQCALPNAAIAAEEGDAVMEEGLQAVDALSGDGRDGDACVPDAFVEGHEVGLYLSGCRSQQVALVEEEHHRHAVGFCRSEESVDEGGARLWEVDGDHEGGLVYVGGDDVALSRLVDRFPDDVVPSVLDVGDESRLLCSGIGGELYADAVAYGHGVGGAEGRLPDAEVALHLARQGFSAVGEHGVPRTGVLDDESLHVVRRS